MLDIKKTLADNVTYLLGTRPDISRLDLSRQMKVADGTLGRIKYGTGNPTVEVLEQIARFFKIEAWQLLMPRLGLDVAETQTQRSDYKKLNDLPQDIREAIEPASLLSFSTADLEEIARFVEFKKSKTAWTDEQRKAG